MKRAGSLIVLAALLLSGCGIADARDKALALDAVKPLPLQDHWLPGLVGVAGYGGMGLGPSGYPNVTSSNTLTPTQKFLSGLELRASDLADGTTVELIDKGDSLAAATLDFCNGSYATEEQRLARRQVAAYNADGSYAGISTEVVQYESATAASDALAELKARKDQCPDGFKYTDSEGIEHTLNFYPAPGPSDTKLMDQRVIFHQVDATADGGNSSLLVWQVRGNVLVAMYATFAGSKPLTDDVLTSLFGVVSVLTERLQAADAVDVGYI